MLEYINILTWFRGFQDKRVLIFETEGQKKLNLKNCNFHIESVWAMLDIDLHLRLDSWKVTLSRECKIK